MILFMATFTALTGYGLGVGLVTLMIVTLVQWRLFRKPGTVAVCLAALAGANAAVLERCGESVNI